MEDQSWNEMYYETGWLSNNVAESEEPHSRSVLWSQLEPFLFADKPGIIYLQPLNNRKVCRSNTIVHNSLIPFLIHTS